MQLLAVLTMESSVSIKKRAEDMLGLTGLGSFDLDGLLSLANEKGYPDRNSEANSQQC
jgi:hypothetical protein